MTKIFIGGFPLEMTEIELVQLVAPHADVVTIKLVRDKATKVCKGYGFMEVADETHALNAIDALNEMQMGDRVLSLNIVREEPLKAPRYQNVQRAVLPERTKRPRRPRI